MTIQFQVGKTYSTRSACDYDTVYRFEIVERTANQLTIREGSKLYVREVYVYQDIEWCKRGTYSTNLRISADREAD